MLPITIKQFQDMLRAAEQAGGFEAEEIWAMFKTVREAVDDLKKKDYNGFLDLIDEAIKDMMDTAISKRGGKAA